MISKISKLNQELIDKWPDQPVGKYKSWFESRAKTFTEINKELSRKVSIEIKAKVKECYRNSMRYMHMGEYYEGYVWNHGIAFEHSWIVIDGKVIDPTLAIDVSFHKDRYGSEYRGIYLKPSIVFDFAMKQEASGPFLIDYWISVRDD